MSENIIRNNIKLFRKKRGLTQQELAKLVGLNYTHIGRIENGERTLDVEYLEVFATALGVKPYELLPKEWQPQEIFEELESVYTLKNKIKEIRKEKGLTQAQLGEKLGVSQSVIQKVEYGTTDLDLPWLIRISKALDISPLELLPDEFITRDEVKIILAIRNILKTKK